MDSMTIGDVARQAGLRPSTIRYYERIGLLPAPERVSGQRRYRREVLQTIATIQVGRQAGLTLNETRELLHGFAGDTPAPARWRSVARFKLDEVDAQLAELQRRKQLLETLRHCQCATIEQCGAAVHSTAS